MNITELWNAISFLKLIHYIPFVFLVKAPGESDNSLTFIKQIIQNKELMTAELKYNHKSRRLGIFTERPDFVYWEEERFLDGTED